MVWICDSCGEVAEGYDPNRCPSCKRLFLYGAKTTLGLTAHLDRDVKLLALSLRDRWDASMLGALSDALEDAQAEELAVRHLRECDHHCLNCWVVREACGLDRPVFAYGG